MSTVHTHESHPCIHSTISPPPPHDDLKGGVMVKRMEQTKRSSLRTCAICWFPRVVSLKSHHFISFLPPHQLFFARFSSRTPDIGARENDKIHEFDAAKTVFEKKNASNRRHSAKTVGWGREERRLLTRIKETERQMKFETRRQEFNFYYVVFIHSSRFT